MIQNCIFKYNNPFTNQKKASLEFQGNVEQNLFFGFKEIEITKLDENYFNYNSIVNVVIAQLNIHSPHILAHTIINSILNYNIQNQFPGDHIFFLLPIVQSSILRFYFSQFQEFTISKAILLNSEIEVNNPVVNFRVLDSQLLNSLLIIDETLGFELSNSYAFKNTSKSKLQSLIYLNKPFIDLNITHSRFKGQFPSIVQNSANKFSSTISTHIKIFDCVFNINDSYNNNISDLFHVQFKEFEYQLLGESPYQQIIVEDYNKYQRYLLPVSVFSLDPLYQMSQKGYHSYSIDKTLIDNNIFLTKIYVEQNNKLLTIVDSNQQPVQIMGNETHVLNFKNPNAHFVSPHQFDLLVNSYASINKLFSQNQQFKIIFQLQQQPIAKAQIKWFEYTNLKQEYGEILNENFKILSPLIQIQAKINYINNEIEIELLSTLSQSIQLTINIAYCQEHQFIFQNRCVDICACDRAISGFYCDTKCQEGFFESGILNECKRCSYGCKLCSNYYQCNECLDGFIINHGFCISSCQIDQFYKNDQCNDCIEDCLICSLRQNPDHLEICSQCSFLKMCQKQQINCDPSCKLCDGDSKYDCLECSAEFDYRLGLCLI